MRVVMQLIIAVLVMAMGFAAPDARAQGIEEKLDAAFDTMSNYTPPSVHMGNRRGMVTGGSLTIRTPVVNIRPFAMRGPSITVGCGGIDAFFGSFSMISKEQLVQAMRAIVTAAITYAFQIALEAMCPTCSDVLKWLQDKLAMANEFVTNSCEATRNFMDNSGIKNRIQDASYKWRADRGMSNDHAESRNQGSTKTATAAAQDEGGGPELNKLPAMGNQVWKILSNAGDASFGFSNDDFFEEIMSMTGTIVACIPKDGSCAAVKALDGAVPIGQQGEIEVWHKPSIMTLSSLVEGQATDAKQFTCGGTDCMEISISVNPVVGMAKKIRDAFLGTPGSAGIIAKMRYNYTGTPTDEELKWMKVGGSITGMAFKLARRDADLARGFIEDNAESMAAEAIVSYLDKYLMSAAVAAGRTDQNGMKEAIDLIKEARIAAHAQAQKYYEMDATKSARFEHYRARLELSAQ